MAHPPEPVRQPKKRFKLQVRYKGSEPDDVVYFSSKPTAQTFPVIGGENLFIAENGNETFTCSNEKDIFSFSITEE